MKKTRWATARNLSAVSAILFISSHAFSNSQIISEFELSLPRQFQQTLIEKKWENLMNQEFRGNWSLPDQQVESQEVPVKIKNISLAIKSFLQKPSLSSSRSQVILTSKGLQAEFRLGEVSVDHVVERSVGGVVGRFRVQALCKDVVLNLTPGRGMFSLVLTPAVDTSKVAMDVESVELGWEPGSLSSPGFQCQGVEGFETLLKKEIENIANDSERFMAPQKELIKRYVQDSLKAVEIDFSQPRELLTARSDIRILMQVDEYQDKGDEGAQVRGHLQLDFLRASGGGVKTLSLGDSSSILSSGAQLRLPKDFLKEVMRHAYTANSWVHRVSSDKIPGFSSLMQSRFLQFFIWPEMMRYSKSAKFIFDVYSNKDIEIQGDGLAYQVRENLLAKMKAPRGGSYVPYLNFYAPLTSTTRLSVNKGRAQVSFINPQLGLSPQWDESYVERFSPWTRFAASTIRDRISQALDGKTVSVAIPRIPLAEGVSLQVEKVVAPTGEDMVLHLTP